MIKLSRVEIAGEEGHLFLWKPDKLLKWASPAMILPLKTFSYESFCPHTEL